MMNMLLLAAVSITTAAGWLESAYAEFPLEANTTYHAYVQSVGAGNWTALDNELIRDYGTYARVDALGLPAGQYALKVVPVRNGAEVEADAATTSALTVSAHDRNGFAHADWNAGVGAYNNDGSLKAGAKVIYVSNANAETVEGVGLQRYIESIRRGPATPVCIRILGTLDKSYLDSIGAAGEGLQIKGNSSYTTMNMTLEGVGRDAAIQNFGLLFRNCTSIEVRNLAVILCMDDCIGFDTNNSHAWVHHCDFFYGRPGSAADQAKGDGTCDMKAGSKYLTFSYNHFWDSGKSSLCGMKSESKDSYITYHHNHFDHSDSRHPRIRTMSVHIYNNYYDGNAKYGVGLTYGASAFVENNYFRACKHPILSSMQGTDAQGEGTFSGEDGGICKAYNNYMTGSGSVRYHSQYGNNSDAYLVTNRQDTVPASVVTIKGNEPYNNFDKYQASVWAITPDAPADARDHVLNLSGRCQKGDIAFTFTGADDTSSDINAALKSLIANYRSGLIRVVGQDTIPNEPQEKPQPEGEGSYECWFTLNGPSSGLYVVNGGTYAKDKGTVDITLQSGQDTTLSVCLKSEGTYKLTLTLEEECTLRIVFGGEKTGSVKIDSKNYTATNQIVMVTLSAGTHTIEKANSSYIYYMLLTPTGTAVRTDSQTKRATKVLREGRIQLQLGERIYELNGMRR